MTHNEQAISVLVQKLVPVFKSQVSANPMSTDQAAGNMVGSEFSLMTFIHTLELLLKHFFPSAR
jgi:hypothetical protein